MGWPVALVLFAAPHCGHGRTLAQASASFLLRARPGRVVLVPFVTRSLLAYAARNLDRCGGTPRRLRATLRVPA